MEPLKNGTKYTYLFLEGVPWGKLSVKDKFYQLFRCQGGKGLERNEGL
jgi:hypothetical protein